MWQSVALAAPAPARVAQVALAWIKPRCPTVLAALSAEHRAANCLRQIFIQFHLRPRASYQSAIYSFFLPSSSYSSSSSSGDGLALRNSENEINWNRKSRGMVVNCVREWDSRGNVLLRTRWFSSASKAREPRGIPKIQLRTGFFLMVTKP